MSIEGPDRITAFGRYLKQWRRQRGLSQLELAVRAGVSQRYLSFIETGRSRPGEHVVQKVSEALEIPLRERNVLLAAAGLAHCYPEVPLSDEAIAPFRAAVRHMLITHEPYPAYVINRWWDIIDANTAGYQMLGYSGDAPVNAADILFGPGQFRDTIENFDEVAWAFLRRLRREVADAGTDTRLQQVLERAERFMMTVPAPIIHVDSDLVVCPRWRNGDHMITTVTMVARFGSAHEVTLDELRVELVFPGDAVAENFFRRRSDLTSE